MVGNSLASHVAGPHRPTPAPWTEDGPETKTRKAVTNPRMRV